MKKLLLTLFLFISTPALAMQPDINVKVNGLVCDFCAQSLTKLFKEDPAINDINVDLEKGLITLDIKDGQAIEDEKITKLITDSGYTVTNIERAASE